MAELIGITDAISGATLRQLASAHRNVGWHAHAFPLSADGVEIVVSLLLRTDRRAGGPAADSVTGGEAVTASAQGDIVDTSSRYLWYRRQ